MAAPSGGRRARLERHLPAPRPCSVDRASSGKGFYCPCHDSSFDPAGKRESGPAPRDLDSLETRVEQDGTVAVQYRRFRQGTAEKSPV